MKIAIAQLNFTVGDLVGNAAKIVEAGRRAADSGARLLVTSELAICGYPPQDLLIQEGFVENCVDAAIQTAKDLGEFGIALLIGSPWKSDGKLYNSALLFDGDQALGVHHKRLLPTYDVFDERRWFTPGHGKSTCLVLDEMRLGVNICEDLWCHAGDMAESEAPSPGFPLDFESDPIAELVADGAYLLINLSASPWSVNLDVEERGYLRRHGRMRYALAEHVRQKFGVDILLANQVGANDGLIFDGNSFGVSADKGTSITMMNFGESLATYDLALDGGLHVDWKNQPMLFDERPAPIYPTSREMLFVDISKEADEPAMKAINDVMGHEDELSLEVLDLQIALEVGVRDYVRKTGHSKAIIGLSGGIDSALVTTIACHALGPENVRAIGMPTRYSSEGSISDSEALCKNLGCSFEVYPIEGIFETFEESFQVPNHVKAAPNSDRTEEERQRRLEVQELESAAPEVFETLPKPRSSDHSGADKPEGLSGLALENIQPRIRGTILMALANQSGALVLAPGNKSELAVGYSTLYGDTVGCLEVIGDLYKTEVYRLSDFYNRAGELIPTAILTKEPSAELRDGQLDSDSLPDYVLLDAILRAYIERAEDVSEIASVLECDEAIVRKVCRMVDIAEFKRKQSPMVLRVSSRAFGQGRQMPVVNGYRPK